MAHAAPGPGSTWFVTGAGRGLGLEIVRAALARGARVVVAAQDPTTVPVDVAASPGVLVVALDVTDPAAVRTAVGSAVVAFGGIDVLVNNAGRGLMGAVEEISDSEARAVFDVNVFGLLDVTRAVLPHMRAAGGGVVVTISSLAGLTGLGGSGVYGATKAAVRTVTEALAEEVELFGIRCMVVEPGVFRTDFLDPVSLALATTRLPAYDGTPAHDRLDGVAERNHRQLGDPARAGALICDVVASGAVPLHLPLGRDAFEAVQRAVDARSGSASPWFERSVATAFAEGGHR